MSYSREEQETTLVFDAVTGTWKVYSTVPKHIRKLAKITEITAIVYQDDRPIAIQGELSEKQVSMKKLVEMSDEKKQAAADRLRKARQK